jgi:hypothetical protein
MISLKTLSEDEMDKLLVEMDLNHNKNYKFAKSATNLWKRFNNFEDNPPFFIEDNKGNIAAVAMVSKLKRSSYINLYEIFAVKKGYATKLYWEIMEFFYFIGVERLKMSCTPESIGWHDKNGIIGWGIDPSGSIRVDIPIFRTQKQQLECRKAGLTSDTIPPIEARRKFLKESYSFGVRKQKKIDEAISVLGENFMRELLHDITNP